jgi:uncharacterized protein
LLHSTRLELAREEEEGLLMAANHNHLGGILIPRSCSQIPAVTFRLLVSAATALTLVCIAESSTAQTARAQAPAQKTATQDSEEAKTLRQAAEGGNPDAQYNLALKYLQGQGVPQDFNQAGFWFGKAAERGLSVAQFFLGEAFEQGAQYTEAMLWYRKAAEQGHADAQLNLGLMYEHGRGVAQDSAEAAKWYHKAADQGRAAAQYDIGLLYEKGSGVTQDHVEAVKWFRMAADQEYVDAQLNLGSMYFSGLGVTQDYAQAVQWWHKAAEQGNGRAQLKLGLSYENGTGVTQDDRQAVEWLRKAAEQGDADAQFTLGAHYAFGKGVALDLVEGHKWVNLASARTSGDQQKQYAATRDELGGKMTSTQITEAQKRAREWLETFQTHASSTDSDRTAHADAPRSSALLAANETTPEKSGAWEEGTVTRVVQVGSVIGFMISTNRMSYLFEQTLQWRWSKTVPLRVGTIVKLRVQGTQAVVVVDDRSYTLELGAATSLPRN